MIREQIADVAIIGGGVGGCAAALSVARSGRTVVMTEETSWIGGQLTSQAVPPDEHPWIEQFGCTMTYRQFRNGVRDYYRRHFPLTTEARSQRYLNPGNGGVSRLCHEPRAALATLQEMLAPYIHNGQLTLLTGYRSHSADVMDDRVRSVTVRHTLSGEECLLSAKYFIDATELGDVLPIIDCEYVTGAESMSDTGEPHALDGPADPLDMQAITYCFAVDYLPNEDHTIDRPQTYDFWRAYQAPFWPNPQLHWNSPSPVTLEPVRRSLFPVEGAHALWHYRRIIDCAQFTTGFYASDISLVNWPQNDYWLGPIIEVSAEEASRHLEAAKQLSLSLLYWMQKEAPRPDRGIGYPGLRLRKDVVGTADGMAMAPYVREARRIRAECTVLEQDVGRSYTDSVGVGAYRIDLHPSTSGRNYIDISSLPFEIPLGSLIPQRFDNVLAASKNIGTTHITNGCYRLHPVEWNIGEAAGFLAAHCVSHGYTPRQVRNSPERLETFQSLLTRAGIEIHWPKLHSL